MAADDERSYFYADGPSPLHEAKAAYIAKRNAAGAEAERLAALIGAEGASGRGRIEGFEFKEKPDPAKWRYVARNNKGKSIYAPKRNSKEGRDLHQRMGAIEFPENNDILRDAGLYVMRFSGRYMLNSGIGWYGDRIFVTIPNAGEGDKFPAIPDYLIPCKRWEMEKFSEEYYAAQAMEESA